MLGGKVIIVTGAGRGIGAACAKAIAKMGGAVVVNDVDTEACRHVVDDIQATNGLAVGLAADLCDSATADRLVQLACDTFGHLDGLLNNAGYFRLSPLLEQTHDELRQMFEVNVVAPMACARAAARVMINEGRGGAIVNVVSGAYLGLKDMGAYGASKGALVSLTYTWAMELQPLGIRVNAMSPRASTSMSCTQARYRALRGEPVNWTGAGDLDPAVNAPLACYLLSDAAKDVTGQIVRIDGDDLSLISPPRLLMPRGSRREWTFEAIAEAFRTDFSGVLQEPGVAAAKKNAMAASPS
jgi:NAD(P)-dependent dehydrogenase (short-subunit alcohol dehydrogenase family)